VADQPDKVAVGSDPLRGSLPRFTLRSLLLGMGVVAVVLAVLQAVGAATGLMLLLMFTAIVLHVIGNALGTRLRDQGTHQQASSGANGPAPRGGFPLGSRAAPVPSHQFAPVTRLSSRASLGWSPIVVTSVAALIGAIVGGRALQRLHPEAATGSTLLLGGLATGALTAMFAYWMASWLQVFLGAWWQAHRHGRGP
jgi:hypothetical protein